MAKFQRLKRRSEFGRVFKFGRTVGDRYIVLFILPNSGGEGRIGFTSQRSAGSAVKRNRIRRRMRALFSLFAGNITSCGDVIVLGKKPVLTEDWDRLVQSMRRLLIKGGCMDKRL
jgi:ribonuclease P protein component